MLHLQSKGKTNTLAKLKLHAIWYTSIKLKMSNSMPKVTNVHFHFMLKVISVSLIYSDEERV